MAEAARTREWTAESRAKLSAACMGRVYGPDVIDRMRAKKCKAVLCVDRGLQFPSQLAAAQALGLNNASISRACRTGCTIAGLRFQFIT